MRRSQIFFYNAFLVHDKLVNTVDFYHLQYYTPLRYVARLKRLAIEPKSYTAGKNLEYFRHFNFFVGKLCITVKLVGKY